ncbi:MAG: RHS repeat-associated core domain-containing protein [Venatoribacter sp.]
MECSFVLDQSNPNYPEQGNITHQTGTQPIMAYAGLYQHKESGLHFATYRAYNSATARWLNRDPIREAGGLNVYAHVGGNPISFIDPNDEIGLYGAAIGGLVGGSSAFMGALSTGANLKDAAISGGVGVLFGAGAGFFDGIGLGSSMVLGGGCNLLGQVLINNLDDDLCNNKDINLGSAIGSAVGGGWASAITKGAGPLSGAIIGWGPAVSSEAVGSAIGKNK